MSRIHISRPLKIPSERGSSHPPTPPAHRLHVSLGYQTNEAEPVSLEDVAGVVLGQPESAKSPLTAPLHHNRVIIVGQKASEISLALGLEMTDELRDEIKYFSESLGLNPPLSPHITLVNRVPFRNTADRNAAMQRKDELIRKLVSITEVDLMPTRTGFGPVALRASELPKLKRLAYNQRYSA